MTKTSPATTASALAKALEKHRGSLRIPEAFDLAVEALFLGIRLDKGLCNDDQLHTRIRTRLKEEAPELAENFVIPLGVAIVEHGLGDDILGRVASHASTLDKTLGQFFTPPDLARLSVALSTDHEDLLAIYRKNGVLTMHEPTIGSGAMAMAWADAAVEAGVPRSGLYIQGWDIEATAARMAYVQLALHGIPARIVLGNVLTLEQRAVWDTPALVKKVRDQEVWAEIGRRIGEAIELMSAPGPEDGDDLAPAA